MCKKCKQSHRYEGYSPSSWQRDVARVLFSEWSGLMQSYNSTLTISSCLATSRCVVRARWSKQLPEMRASSPGTLRTCRQRQPFIFALKGVHWITYNMKGPLLMASTQFLWYEEDAQSQDLLGREALFSGEQRKHQSMQATKTKYFTTQQCLEPTNIVSKIGSCLVCCSTR